MVAKSWRTHKSDLTRNFINKGLDATVKHTYILKEDWAAFVKLKDKKKQRQQVRSTRSFGRGTCMTTTWGQQGMKETAKWE